MKKFKFNYSHSWSNDYFSNEEYAIAEQLIKLAKDCGFQDKDIYFCPLREFLCEDGYTGLHLFADNVWKTVFKERNIYLLCEKMEYKLEKLANKLHVNIYCEAYENDSINIYLDK